MDQTVIQTAEGIRSMEIRGAGRIARAAASAMGAFASAYAGSDPDEFRGALSAASATLLASRPTAVSLRNGVMATLRGMNRWMTVEQTRESVTANADAFVQRSEKAVDTIVKIGAKRIRDGDTVLTHCNSSVAVGIIVEAHRQGKEIKAYATESRPWRQGLLTIRDLSQAGVDTTLIIDSAVRSVMERVDEVFVGADTVTSHGALINKVGTSQVALAAKEARADFFACCETYKFSPLTVMGDMVEIEERDASEVASPDEIPPGVKVFNPVFDCTPAEYIDAVITEIGMISPGSVYDVILRQFGDELPLE